MSTTKKVLLLGAGFVTKAPISILAESGIEVTVACRHLDSAQKLCHGITNATPIALDVTVPEQLDVEVAKVDVVVSLIPYTLHAAVIRSAIRHKKNVVTTSYVSPAMLELEKEVKEAGITVMNEIGLDPGIDHLYAVKTIDDVHRVGGKIISFLSYCGGLPAPEASGNPLGYKFSWSPRGVLLALRNSAKYYQDGQVVEIPGEKLMGSAKPYFIYPGFALVAYPNRDSTPYKERYRIPEAQTVIRGTLRYQGFPEFVRVLGDIGFLSDETVPYLAQSGTPPAWKDVLGKMLEVAAPEEANLVSAITSRTKFQDDAEKQRIIAGLRWLGLFSTEPVLPRDNPLDTLCATLEAKMQYAPDERDMVLLQHRFEIEYPDGRREIRTSTLLEYGEPNGSSAMARLVGVPCAVATKFVLDETISEKGILAPLDSKINDPLMKELKMKYGIECREEILP